MEVSMNNEKNAVKTKQPGPLHFLMDHLPSAIREKAEIELHETVESRVEGIKEIRELIKCENSLADIEFHSDFLLQFLRHSKYDVKKAFNRLENFISNKRNLNTLFNSLTDQMFEKVKAANIIKCLPWRTSDGSVIIIVKFGNWDPSKISLNDINRYALVVIQQCLRDPMTQICGFAFIYDWRNISMRTMSQFTPKVLYEVAKAYIDCIPARYRELHGINHPTAVKFVWAIAKPLMTEKLKRRVIFHSDKKDLLNYIPPSLMPAENGGYLNEEFYESIMSGWLKKAFEEQKQSPLGGQCNYYSD